jgi:hypothetical protein
LIEKFFNKLTDRKKAQLEATKARIAEEGEARLAAFGLVPADRLDAGRASAPVPQTEAVLAQVRDGDWRAGAEWLAKAQGDQTLRTHRIRLLAECAVQDDGWLRTWLGEQPGSGDAHAVQIDSLALLAWEIRSSKGAQHVTGEQFEGFHRVLRQVGPAADEAARLDPQDPAPWASRLPAAMGLGVSHEEFRALFAEVTARDPHHYGGHVRAMQYWCEKWHGSHELMHAFAAEAVATAPAESMLAVLPLSALLEEYARSRESEVWARPEATAAVDGLLAAVAAVPADDYRIPRARHLLAYSLVFTNRPKEALGHFQAVSPYVGSEPWTLLGSPADRFDRFQRIAVKHSMRP